MKRDSDLDEFIQRSKDLASGCNDWEHAENLWKVNRWLEELRVRRRHKPLRCWLGFHRTVYVHSVYTWEYLDGTVRKVEGIECMCLLCGKRWESSLFRSNIEALSLIFWDVLDRHPIDHPPQARITPPHTRRKDLASSPREEAILHLRWSKT